MSYVPAQNVTDAPIVIDLEGRTLGGGEWGAVDRHDDAVRAAVDAGSLVLQTGIDAGTSGLAPDARAAVESADELESRRAAIADAEVDHLRELADAAELDGPGASYDSIGKALLARRLVRSGVPLNLPPDEPPSGSDTDPPPAAKAAPVKKAAAPRGGTP